MPLLLDPRKPNFGAIHRKHHRLDVVVRGCIVQEHATRQLHLCARDFEGHGELGNTVVSDRHPRHSDIGELDDLLRQSLAEIVDDISQRRAVGIPQVRKTPGKRERGVARARFVRAGDNDPVASFDLGGGDDALVGGQRVDIHTESGRRFGTDGDSDTALACGEWQVHRHGLEAEADGDVRGRGNGCGNRLLPEHELGVDEIDDAVAVSVFEDETFVEELVQGTLGTRVRREA